MNRALLQRHSEICHVIQNLNGVKTIKVLLDDKDTSRTIREDKPGEPTESLIQ